MSEVHERPSLQPTPDRQVPAPSQASPVVQALLSEQATVVGWGLQAVWLVAGVQRSQGLAGLATPSP